MVGKKRLLIRTILVSVITSMGFLSGCSWLPFVHAQAKQFEHWNLDLTCVQLAKSFQAVNTTSYSYALDLQAPDQQHQFILLLQFKNALLQTMVLNSLGAKVYSSQIDNSLGFQNEKIMPLLGDVRFRSVIQAVIVAANEANTPACYSSVKKNTDWLVANYQDGNVDQIKITLPYLGYNVQLRRLKNAQ